MHHRPTPLFLLSSNPQSPVPYQYSYAWNTPTMGHLYQWNSPPLNTCQNDQFYLCFHSGNISVCNGCRNKFDKNASAPLDLCVRHEEWHSFTSPVTKEIESRFGNAYYHTHLPCIYSKWPNFNKQSLVIIDIVIRRLQPEYKHIFDIFL